MFHARTRFAPPGYNAVFVIPGIAMRILIVEDDPLLADGLTQTLRRQGYLADCVSSAEKADAAVAQEEFGLVILDVGLPGMDGFELLRRWRNAGQSVPVLVLTARDALSDRVFGLNLGADDYLTKPYATEELLARVAAIVRRSRSMTAMRRTHGPLVLDLDARRALLQDQPLDLPLREWAILEVLLDNVGRVVSKDQIVGGVCTWEDELSPNAVEVYMSRLRAKLESAGIVIRTVRGFGYMLEAYRDAVQK